MYMLSAPPFRHPPKDSNVITAAVLSVGGKGTWKASRGNAGEI